MSDEPAEEKGVRRQGVVTCRGARAGVLQELADGSYRFRYDDGYLADPALPAVSLTLPRRAEPFVSDELFPFFFGLLSEGTTRRLQARMLGIDADDSFGLLLATGADAVGAVSVTGDG